MSSLQFRNTRNHHQHYLSNFARLGKMCSTIAGDEAHGSLKPEPTEVYQEAAFNLRRKKVTAMTARKLERTMTLLHLKPCHLIKCGLAHKSSSEQDWKCPGNKEKRQLSPSEAVDLGNSVRTTVSCVQVRLVSNFYVRSSKSFVTNRFRPSATT